MGVLEDFGHGRLRGRLSPRVNLVACYVTYEGHAPPSLPDRFGSVHDALMEWVYGLGPYGWPVQGSVVDFFLRTLGITLDPVGGPRVWHLTLSAADHSVGGKVREGEELRGLVKSRLSEAMASAGFPISALDADGDRKVESPDGEPVPPELLVLALDNLFAAGGQTGSTSPDAVSIDHGCTWSGSVSGLAAAAGVSTMCHELLHQYGTVDLYGAGFGRNQGFTTMAASPADPDMRVRLDPWHEMQLGVTSPVIADLTVPGSVTIEHAGGDGNRRAVLLTDPARRFEGFMVQLRRGLQDPIDTAGPNGWCLWQVAVDASTHGRLILPSWHQAGGRDASINALGAPDLVRGDGSAWPDGTTPELSWPNGAETGAALTFTSAADGLAGTVSWAQVPTSWKHRRPAFDSFSAGQLPCAAAPGLTLDPASRLPIVGALTSSGEMRLNMVFDSESLSPWAIAPVVGSSRAVAMTRSETAVAAAFVSPAGRVLVDYPPDFDAPSDCGAVATVGAASITLHGDEVVVAWRSGDEIVIGHHAPDDPGWRHERLVLADQFEIPMAGTSPALVTTMSGAAEGTCLLAWTGADGIVRIRRRGALGSWRAEFELDYGITVPAVLTMDSGFATSSSPALAVGPDGAVWVVVQMASRPTHVAYGRTPAALGGLEPGIQKVGSPPKFWRPLWRHVEIGPMTAPVAVTGDVSNLQIAWLPRPGSPVRIGTLPTT